MDYRQKAKASAELKAGSQMTSHRYTLFQLDEQELQKLLLMLAPSESDGMAAPHVTVSAGVHSDTLWRYRVGLTPEQVAYLALRGKYEWLSGKMFIGQLS